MFVTGWRNMTSAQPTTLYFDARYIRVDHHDGISRFSAGLFAAISRRIDTVAIISDLRQLDALPKHSRYILLNSPTSFLGELTIARKLNQLGAKLVFSPMQTIGSFGRKFKLVVTLHDLIYYRHPSPPPSLPWAIRAGWRLFHLSYWPQRFLLNQADAVVTVSQTTKELILRHKLTRKPVHVVYNAATSAKQQLNREHEQPKGVGKLIYMGSFMAYKNVETLVLAMNHLHDCELHLLSKIDSKTKERLQLLAPNSKLIFHNGVSDRQYLKLLDGARALVSASRDEGFGIPVIEAMGRGCPVVISDMPIFQEVGGAAALYFNCDSADDFVKSVRTLDNAKNWKKHSRLALQQAQNFNWEKSAEALIAAINSL